MKLNRPVIFAVFVVLALTAITFGLTSVAAAADDRSEAQMVVDRARTTLYDFMQDPNFTWFHENLPNAKGLLIFPRIVKAGFIVGGSGGTGVLVVKRGESCDWSDPAFYTIGSASLGLQAGGQSAESVIMVMTDRALDSLLRSSLKLGTDASIAAGPRGSSEITTIRSDLISFSRSKGLYAGIDLQGSVLHVRDGLNRAYYGRNVAPQDIVMNNVVRNRGADDLLFTLHDSLPEGFCLG